MGDLGPFIAVAVLTLVLVAGNYVWPTRRRRINQALASRPLALVHGAQGTVRVTGRARRIGELLRAPLSGRPCVAYEVLVDEPDRVLGGAGWRRRVELREVPSFLVADESGATRIDTSGPFLMSLNYDHKGDTDAYSKYPGKHPALASFLSSLDVVTSGLAR